MEPAPNPSPRPAWRVWARRLGPWVITIAVVAYLLTQYSLGEIVAEMQRGNAIALAPVAAVMVLISLGLVSTADLLVIRGILGRPGLGVVVRGKAASSLLDLLGYAVGHGSYAIWIARRGGTDALTAAGIMLYIMASDLAAVCVVATLAVLAGAPAVPPFVVIGAPIVAGVLLLFKVVGPLKPLGERSPRVFHPWSELSRAHAFGQLALRVTNIGAISIASWIALTAFGIAAPLSAAIVRVPVILLVGSLPINVAGFGAVQATWLLFDPWATGEQILAFQFLWHLALFVAITLRGLPFVRRMVAEVDAGSRDSP